MVPEIVWSEDALLGLDKEIIYLEQNFTNTEIQKFTTRIAQKLLLIQSNPRLGRKVGYKQNVYQTTINKRIVLFYFHRPLKKEIHILAIWNTLEYPKKLKI
jgi:plasmid stabilization system protein ParE